MLHNFLVCDLGSHNGNICYPSRLTGKKKVSGQEIDEGWISDFSCHVGLVFLYDLALDHHGVLEVQEILVALQRSRALSPER